MSHFRELISVLLLVLLAWTLVTSAGAPDLAFVLPVIATLLSAWLTQRLTRGPVSPPRVLGPSISFVYLRAPPQQ